MHIFRPIVFMILGIWGIVPIIHAYIIHNKDPVIRKVIALCFAQLISHFIGAMFYITQWPEISNSSNITITDYINSHFIFHLFIILGLLFFHCAMMNLYKWRCSRFAS
jgi:adiponectin receptor